MRRKIHASETPCIFSHPTPMTAKPHLSMSLSEYTLLLSHEPLNSKRFSSWCDFSHSHIHFLNQLVFFCLKNSFLKLRENGFKIMRETRSFFSFSFIFQFIYIVAYDFLFFFFFLLFIKPIEYPLMNTFSMFVSLIIQLFKEELNWMPNVLLL